MEPPATTNAIATARIHDVLLATLEAGAGAKMGVWFGCALPDHFGDPEKEFRFANQSVALIDKNYRAHLSFSGPDRVRYLNAILTNNIKDLAVGHGNVSLLLNPQGHILAELETYAFAERLLCVSYAMIREQLIEWMDKYIIMDDVTLTDETDRWGTLALEGPRAAAVVKELTGVDLGPMDELASLDGPCFSADVILSEAKDLSEGPIPFRIEPQDDRAIHAAASSSSSHPDTPPVISSEAGPPFLARSLQRTRGPAQSRNPSSSSAADPLPYRIVKRSPGGVAGAEFVVERAQLAQLWQILLDAVRRHGGGPMGYEALSAQRLAQGVPWFGYDFGDKQIPHEAGLENTHISFTKGCYTGQEIVERVRSRGQVHRRRVQLQFEGPPPVAQAGTRPDPVGRPEGTPASEGSSETNALPEAGAILMVDGKEAGTVTRAARAWDPPRVLGMGYVKGPSNAPGTVLQWEKGRVEVIL